ncbi:nucleotidyltransferase family protein [Thiolinea disciformis]|uniref:nucleotidyltransferase family protein n=1 Tax=Thiolinea disciformis TaxID=125614 RepID=UPI00036FD601|nr:nucleotidyltransferase family protein [Thiolinea disciformis]
MPKRYGAELTAVLLAAGQSTRFGSAKLLHPLANGIPLGLQAAHHLQALFDEVLVVVNANSPPLQQHYQDLGLNSLIHHQADQGIGSSIAKAIEHSSPRQGWLIVLADMPFIQASSFCAVADALLSGAKLAAPTYQDKRGHPVGFSSYFKNELLNLNQDQGAQQILKKYAPQLQLIPTQDQGILIDIDTLDDLNTFHLDEKPRSPR